MSRSGYGDDFDDQKLAMWRGRVASAMRGKRGQQLLRDALEALDAMPDKALIADEFVDGSGRVCLLGACGRKRGIADLEKISPEDHDVLAKKFNVASCLIKEIEFLNDEYFCGGQETPQSRFDRMRAWLVKHIAKGGDCWAFDNATIKRAAKA